MSRCRSLPALREVILLGLKCQGELSRGEQNQPSRQSQFSRAMGKCNQSGGTKPIRTAGKKERLAQSDEAFERER